MANSVLYGFLSLKDLFGERVTQVGESVINEAISASVAEHNRQISSLIGLFVKPTTDHLLRFKTPISARLQPLDEYGRARPIKRAGYYDVAFPIQMAGSAFGQTYVASQKSTVQEVNDNLSAILSADMRWMRDHILSALYDNTNWTFSDEEFGNLTVKPLANGDTDTYMIFSGADSVATDTHFLAQAAAIADGANPFPTIYDELVEHPENGSDVIVLAPSNLIATIEGLTNFFEQPDPQIQLGQDTSYLAGSLGVQVPGEMVGRVDKCWIVEWRSLPDSYMIAVTASGEKPLGMRQDPEASLQGFSEVAQRDDYPYYERQWMRRAGFGAWNRVGGLVYRVGNASYAIPTGYTNPIP